MLSCKSVSLLLILVISIISIISINETSSLTGPSEKLETPIEEEVRKNSDFELDNLEGPDYIQPPKNYKTLEMILAESSLTEMARGPPPIPVSGERELLVILVELSDVTSDGSHTTAYFEDRFFDTTPPSVRDYYLEVSYGMFTYVPGAVVGWYHSTYNQAQWISDSRPIVAEAIQNADDYFDFAPYDTSGDGTVTNDELTIFMIVSGDYGGAHHWWTISPVSTDDGVTVEGEYSATYEYRHVGSYLHELGHDLGLPDLYDTPSGGSYGIGDYGLMGSGSWTSSHMTAWSKIQLGWINPTVVTANGYYYVDDAETHPEAYILIDETYSSTEYFLIENRYPANSYYETVDGDVSPGGVFPDEGIIIYHIDETRIQEWITLGRNNVNDDEAHKGVDVECADSPTSHYENADDLDKSLNRGDSTDLWDSTTYYFTDHSTPCNANWYVSTASGMAVREFPDAGPTMRVYMQVTELPPPDEPTYPGDKWERLWYVHTGSMSDPWGDFLGVGPHESELNFDNNYGHGTIAYGRSDYIGFVSSRTVTLDAGTYTFTIGGDGAVRLFIDDELVIGEGWYSHSYRTYSYTTSYATSGDHQFRLEWTERTSGARVSFTSSYTEPTPPPPDEPEPTYPGDRWERLWYVHTGSMSDPWGEFLGSGPDETNLNFDNNYGRGTIAYGRSDYIGFVSSRTVTLDAGTYTFTIGGDGAVRLFIDDELVIGEGWYSHSYRTYSYTTSYATSGDHQFRLEWTERTSGARVAFTSSFTSESSLG